jgi:hypothetical protein
MKVRLGVGLSKKRRITDSKSKNYLIFNEFISFEINNTSLIYFFDFCLSLFLRFHPSAVKMRVELFNVELPSTTTFLDDIF